MASPPRKKSAKRKALRTPSLKVFKPKGRKTNPWQTRLRRDKKLVQETWVLATLVLSEGIEQYGSLGAFADAAKVSRSTVYRLWSRKTYFPCFATIAKLAREANVPMKIEW